MANDLITFRGLVLQSNSEMIKDGGIVVRDNTIIDVGSWDRIDTEYDTSHLIGSKDHIITPGFVNTHSHAVQTLFRGAADDLELLPWLEQVILPGEATLNASELEASCRIGYAEMLLSGITTTNDMLTANHASEGMQAAIDSGIRGKVGKMLMDRNVPEGLLENTSDIIEEVKQHVERHPAGNRVEFSLTPRFIPTCTDELMREASSIAKENGLTFHTHASENKGECELVRDLTGRSYIGAMQDLDALGDHVILAHAVWTSEEERQLLQQTSTSISYNPSSNSKLASGIAPIPEYLEQGLSVGLATDGSPATGGHDFFLEMKLSTFLQKASRQDPKILPARTVFHLATSGGAKALNYDNIGLIKPGYKADLVSIQPKFPSAYPRYDPYSYVVYTAQTRDIDTVMVDGDIQVREGELQQSMDNFYQIAEKYATERPFETRQ